MKKHPTHALFAALILLVFTAGIFTLQANVAHSFEVAKSAYLQASEVNASLALSVAGDIASGKDPVTLKEAFLAAKERQIEAATALDAVRSGWMVFGARARGTLSDQAKKETVALSGVADAVEELASLPEEEWSPTIDSLRKETSDFQTVHEQIIQE